MIFKIYYVRVNKMSFVKALAEYLVDILNTLRKSDDTKLLCIQDCYGEKFML